MPILNYTTTIAASKSVGEIHGILAKHGARSIGVNYDEMGEPCAITFVVNTQIGERTFALPANVDGVQRVLRKQLGNSVRSQPSQAARVAFRILKDWVAAQMAIIDAGMVTMVEVMLPYMLAPSGTQTMFEAFEARELEKMLLPEYVISGE